MSTLDDQAKEISEDTAGDAAATQSPEAKMDEQVNGPGGPIILFFILGLFVSLIMGWIIFPKLLYSQKKQPIDFNHAFHVAEVENGCESCHFFREDGTFSGAPKLEQCVDCHEEIQGVDPDEIKFVEEYVSKEREVPWLIYSKQPDCVFFSHAAHIKGADMDCVICHGHIGDSESLKVYEENRITGYSRDVWGKNIGGFKKNTWDRMKMDDCADCHQKKSANIEKTGVKTPTKRLVDHIIEVVSPGASISGKGTSVQTERDACFVCHK
ncbi:MAG: cytochrome c3 family protein [Deltaproteobacteria bacterium]|nr:cytochrome c3 family protein [Deltaproteobacteria bacterium]